MHSAVDTDINITKFVFYFWQRNLFSICEWAWGKERLKADLTVLSSHPQDPTVRISKHISKAVWFLPFSTLKVSALFGS